MELLTILLIVNFFLLILILALLVFSIKAKMERYNSNKTARELQKIKKQII